MQSKATTVEAYLKELPADRRAAINTVRAVILKSLDKGYEEGMYYGMIMYYVPHRLYPAGYHCDPSKPLGAVALASQKHYMSFYLGTVYCGCDGSDPAPQARWFREAWAKTGKKLDMGKSCIRFKRVEDLALDVIAEAIKRVPMKMQIESYEAARAAVHARKVKGKPSQKAKPAKRARR
ncbi:hypothetical protein PLCT2_02851 [Planctomycetaceae bacterium]|nr:hypothetical protein PLCT2_02851 [Planctomycetaceae bacterium]